MFSSRYSECQFAVFKPDFFARPLNGFHRESAFAAALHQRTSVKVFVVPDIQFSRFTIESLSEIFALELLS
jgi:hypothetical protein